MKLTVDYMNRLDKEIEENQKKRVEQEIERRKDPFYRFGTKAITGSLKMFNLPGNIYSAVTGKEVQDAVPQYVYPEAETGAQKFADITGTLAGEIGESALLGIMLSPLGIGSKVASGTTKLLKGGKAAQVVGKMAGSAAENIAEDLISDTARGIADKKSAGEIAKDFGTSVLFDTAAAGVLEGIPAIVRGVKNGKAASKAASAAKEAAENVGQTIDDSRRVWDEIGGVADDVADTATDVAKVQQKAAADVTPTTADIMPGKNAVATAQDVASDGADVARNTTNAAADIISDTAHVGNAGTYADVISEVGDQRAFRNAYNAIDSGDIPLNQAVTVGNRTATVGEFADAIEARLPDDPDYLERFVRDSDAELSKASRLKINLQLFAQEAGEELDDASKLALQKYAAERKLEWMKLAPSEDGTKVRGYLQNRLKGEDITSTPELIEVLSGRVDKYTPKADAELLENARKLIDGDEAKNGLYNRFMNADSNTLFTDEEIAAAELMASDFIRDGALEEAADLLTGISRSGTAAGRSLRAYSFMKMLTPEGTIKYAQRLMNGAADERFYKGFSEELDNFLSGLAKKLQSIDGSIDPDGLTKIINQHISSLSPDSRLKNILSRKNTAVAQRIVEASQEGLLNSGNMHRVLSDVLDVPNLDEDTISRLVDLVNQAKSVADGGIEHAEIFEEIYRTLAEKMPVSMMDKLNTWRKIGMLSNPKTHARNIISNAVNIPQRKLNDLFATLYERMQDPSVRTHYFGWKRSEFGKEIADIVEEQTKKAIPELKKVGKYDLSENVIKKYRRIFENEPMERVQKFVSDALQKEDDYFKIKAYRDALGQAMVARHTDVVTQELHELALEQAFEATFQAETAIGKAFEAVKKVPGVGKVVDGIIPFTKTPANLVTQAIDYSPLGFVHAAMQNAARAKTGKSAAEAINTLAKATTGSLEMLAAGLLLGATGAMTTSMSSGKAKSIDELEGKSRFSINMFGHNISIDWLQPTAFPIIAGAAVGNAIANEDSTVIDTLFSGTDSIFQLSMLQSLSDLAGGGYGSTSENYADLFGNYLRQYIPAPIGALGRTIDPVQRSTKGDNFIETFFKNVQNSIGLGGVDLPVIGKLDPELDVWGNEVLRTGRNSDANKIWNAVQQFVSPSNVKTELYPDDVVTQAMLDLYNRSALENQNKNKMVPGTVTDSWKLPDGTLVKDSDVYEQAMRDVGKAQKQAAEDFIVDGDKVQITVGTGRTNAKGEEVKHKKWVSWNTATDEEKIKALGKIFEDTAKKVKDAYEKNTVDRLWKGVLKNG